MNSFLMELALNYISEDTLNAEHSGFELWFREKKSAWHMTFTQS